MTFPLPDALSEAPGLPADSSYELITKEMCSGSEGDTVSVASTGVLTDLSLGDDDFDTVVEDEQANDYFGHPPPPPPPPPPPTMTTAIAEAFSESRLYSSTADSSMMFSGTETQGSEVTFRTLEEEQSADGSIMASGTIRVFESPLAMPKVLEDFGRQQLRLAVKMAMSKRMLPPRRSYRIVYVGQLDHWVGTDINSHIGAALNMTPSSSRFNIVQGSEWPGASGSRVQLERSGSELVVDHCSAPRLVSSPHRRREIMITLSDGSALWVGVDGEVHSPTSATPDLIIFCHSGEDKLQESTRHLRRALQDSGFPTLDIAVVRPYTSEESIFRKGNLCLHIEGRDKDEGAFETQKIIPIDLYAFLSLEPTQLNRHLAYLAAQNHQTKNNESFRESAYPYEKYPQILDNIPGYYNAKNKYRSRAWANFIMGLVIATSLLTLLYYGLYFRAEVTSSLGKACPIADTPEAPAWTLSTSKKTQSTPTQAVVSESLNRHQPPSVSSPAVPDPKTLSRARCVYMAALKNGLWHFDIARHDIHLHLRPRPALVDALTELKKALDLHTVATLEDTEQHVKVPSSSFWVDRNHYVVEVAYPMPVRPVVCRILLMDGTKVLAQQEIETTIGLPKPPTSGAVFIGKIEYGMAVIEENVLKCMTRVKDKITPAVHGIHNGALITIEHARHWRKELAGSIRDMVDEFLEVEPKVLHIQARALEQANSYYDAFKKTLSRELPPAWERYTSYAETARQTVTENVRESTRPWRTSPRLIQARKRAMKMRCKLEKAFTEDPASCGHVKN